MKIQFKPPFFGEDASSPVLTNREPTDLKCQESLNIQKAFLQYRHSSYLWRGWYIFCTIFNTT